MSWFHFFDRQRHLKAKAAAGIDAFCQAHLALWEESLAGYLRASDEGFPVLFVPYELLLQYPVEILSNLLRWLGARNDPVTVERAVSNMQFRKLQEMEARTYHNGSARNHPDKQFMKQRVVEAPGLLNDDAFFFRRGCKGSGRAELKSSTMDIIQERTAFLLEQANARVLAQQSLEGRPASPKTTQILKDAASQNRRSKPLPTVVKLQKV